MPAEACVVAVVVIAVACAEAEEAVAAAEIVVVAVAVVGLVAAEEAAPVEARAESELEPRWPSSPILASLECSSPAAKTTCC